jgi:hypothetical protein
MSFLVYAPVAKEYVMYGLMQVSMTWRHCEGEAMLSRRALPFSMTAAVSSLIWKRQLRVGVSCIPKYL